MRAWVLVLVMVVGCGPIADTRDVHPAVPFQKTECAYAPSGRELCLESDGGSVCFEVDGGLCQGAE